MSRRNKPIVLDVQNDPYLQEIVAETDIPDEELQEQLNNEEVVLSDSTTTPTDVSPESIEDVVAHPESQEDVPSSPVVRVTIRSTAESALADGLSVPEALKAVRAAHPGANTTEGCIRWYSSQMKRNGKIRLGVGRRTPAPDVSSVLNEEERAWLTEVLETADDLVASRVMRKLGL